MMRGEELKVKITKSEYDVIKGIMKSRIER